MNIYTDEGKWCVWKDFGKLVNANSGHATHSVVRYNHQEETVENLQEALDKLKANKAKYIQEAQMGVNQQIAWFDGGIAALDAILHPKEEGADEAKTTG